VFTLILELSALCSLAIEQIVEKGMVALVQVLYGLVSEVKANITSFEQGLPVSL
jgi:hypothetical protein